MSITSILPSHLVDRLASGDERWAITGASGWFGLTAIDLLFAAIGPKEFSQRVSAFASRTCKIQLPDGSEVIAQPLGQLVTSKPFPTHLLHFAYPTREKVAVLGIDAFVRTTTEISLVVLRLLQTLRVAGLFYTSSGAVYRVGAQHETLQGNFTANAYGVMKQIDELALRQCCRDFGTTSVVARVFSVSGPRMTKRHLYALGDLITQALTSSSVEVRARGLVRRSYVSVAEVVAVAIGELLEPTVLDLIFDTGGEEIVEVSELAARVCSVIGQPKGGVLPRDELTDPPDDYHGEGSAFRALAANRGLKLAGLDEQIRQTAASWSDPARSLFIREEDHDR